jgi:hypothetical protein
MSGYVFMLAGATVSWRSCKQTVLTKSTTEAKLVALETTTNEAEWLRVLLMDLTFIDSRYCLSYYIVITNQC